MSRFNVLKNIMNKFKGSIYKFNVMVQCGWSIWPTIYNLAFGKGGEGMDELEVKSVALDKGTYKSLDSW